MSADLERLLAKATPGKWEVDGPPWNQIIWSDAGNRVCFMAHSNGLDDERDIQTARLIAMAPDLARQVIALTAENAALRAKVEKLAEALRERDGGVHDDDCKVFRPAAGFFALPCNCGHDDAEAALTEWETP